MLTRDARIRYNPLEIHALKATQVSALVSVPKNLAGEEMALLIVEALPQMQRTALKTQRPFCFQDLSLQLAQSD